MEVEVEGYGTLSRAIQGSGVWGNCGDGGDGGFKLRVLGDVKFGLIMRLDLHGVCTVYY